MKLFLRRAWPLWGLFLCCLHMASMQGLGQVPAGPVVEKIEVRHVGPPAASEDLVRANIRIKPGDSYNVRSTEDDVATLYATGLFHDVKVAREEAGPGRVNLIYLLQGKATLTDIRFDGNKKYSEKKLLRKVTSKIGEPLSEQKLFEDSRALQELYQKAGYQRTTVRAAPVIDPQTGRGRVTFEIKEAPKIRIDEVEFIGANAFPQKRLRKEIKTREHWMFSWITGSGVLKDEQFEQDKDRLTTFYQNNGYIDFEIKNVQFEQVDAKHMIIRFEIAEGQQYRIGSIDITGNKLFPDEEILAGAQRFARPEKNEAGLRLAPGKIYTPAGLTHDTQAIQDFYNSKGYLIDPGAGVAARRKPNVEQGTMDIVYEVLGEAQGVSYVERVDIRGNTKTRDKVIRRELAISPGDVFDMVRVKRSKGRLEQMQFFQKVETEVEPTDIPNRKNLIIGLEEGTTGNVELGAGFSSVDNLVGFVGYREGNFDLFNPPYFRGGGQKFRINLALGTERKDLEIEFVEPWFLGRKLAFGTTLYHRELQYYSDLYDVTRTGVQFSLTRTLGSDFLLGSVNYTFENIEMDDIGLLAPQDIKDEEGDRLVSKLGFSLAYDTRNNVQLPDRGQRTELSTEYAGGPLGADTDIYKIRLGTGWYFPGFFRGHLWELIGQVAVVETHNGMDKVPVFDRYALGGIDTLRGYDYREVGPTYDPITGETLGGNMSWYGSIEYSLPVIERLRFAVFYDIGNVYLDAYSFDREPGQPSYTDNWGVGIRLAIPRLPLRLDYAIPIKHDDNLSGSGQFQFSFGYSRNF